MRTTAQTRKIIFFLLMFILVVLGIAAGIRSGAFSGSDVLATLGLIVVIAIIITVIYFFGAKLKGFAVVVLAVGFVLVVTLVLFSFALSSKKSAEAEEKKAEVEKTQATAKAQQAKKAPVPEDWCTTPCTPIVGYGKEIWGSGSPMQIKFNGVDHAVDYPAESRPCEGRFQAPLSFKPGSAEIKSPDPNNPKKDLNIRIQIFDRNAVCR